MLLSEGAFYTVGHLFDSVSKELVGIGWFDENRANVPMLTFDVFWSRPYAVDIFGRKQDVVLVIQTFDDDEITDNQRQTFDDFERNKQKIISEVENAVFSYYKDNFDPAVCSISDVAGLVDLLKIKIMYSEAGENQEVGFIFSASFDPELGVGVLLSNGKIEDVDVQDIVLG